MAGAGSPPGWRTASGPKGSDGPAVQYLSFSDDGGAFAAGLTSGFTVHESTTKKLGASFGGGVHIVKIVESDAE
jgi:hypothetical protein